MFGNDIKSKNMWTIEISRQTTATKEQIWNLWADVGDDRFFDFFLFKGFWKTNGKRTFHTNLRGSTL